MTSIRGKPDTDRRNLLKRLAGGAAAASVPVGVGGIMEMASAADQAAGPKDLKIVMDGHVHVTTRAYWEDIDLWKPQPAGTGWNFAQARAGGRSEEHTSELQSHIISD